MTADNDKKKESQPDNDSVKVEVPVFHEFVYIASASYIVFMTFVAIHVAE